MRKFQRLALAFFLVANLAVCVAADTVGETRRIAEFLALEEGQHVADVGAGNGEFSVELSKLVGTQGQVYATEVDNEKIEKLDKLVQRRKIGNIRTILGSQDATGLEPASVDAVMIRLVYHHFAHPEKMREDLKRALRPGGRIAIIDFGPENGLSRANVPAFRNGHGVAAEKVIEEMSTAGFRLEERRNDWDRDNYLLIFSLP